jgi:squalene-hopene/tetraprenyl-beta-curcumene cyclase
MQRTTLLSLALSVIAMSTVIAAEPKPRAKPLSKPRPKPQFQFDSGDIRIPIPTADEPKMKSFDAASVRAAAKYLDDGVVAWMRSRSCVACHTPGAYMLSRPMLTKQLGSPKEEVLAEFVKSIDDKVPAMKEDGGISYSPAAPRAVWRTAGLVEWDKHVAGRLSEHTDRALRNMLLQQSSHGGYHVMGEVEIPYQTTDLELTLHAAQAIADAPGWLTSLQDADLLQRVERIKQFLRDTKPRNDYERAVRLALAARMPDVVRLEDREADIAMLWSKQKPDGGWSTRDMSDTLNWRAKISDTVVQLIEGLPDAKNPASDPYMTALAIVLLRESGTPADDARIQRGIAWLKGEQRASGRWWMHSLYRGNFHFTTYIATAKSMQALAMCGEIPMLAEKDKAAIQVGMRP